MHTTTVMQGGLLRRRQEALDFASSKDDWTNAVPPVLTSRRKIMRVVQIVTTEGDATVSWPRHITHGQSGHLQCEGNREAFVGKATLPKGETEMVPGLYSAASAMSVADQRHQVVAQNLAHINMPGYRRSVAHQQTFESSLDEASQGKFQFDLLGTSFVNAEVDFTPGSYEQTGRKLDLALHGDGFFTIEAEGQQLYTRNGAFQTDQDGRLMTSDGYPVVGETGEIVIPPDASPGMLSVAKDGTAQIGDQVIGKLRIVNFANPGQLQQRGITLFAAPDGVQPEASDAFVEQGARERSNVTPVLEMVELIAINRSHDAAQKAMSAISDAVKKRIET